MAIHVRPFEEIDRAPLRRLSLDSRDATFRWQPTGPLRACLSPVVTRHPRIDQRGTGREGHIFRLCSSASRHALNLSASSLEGEHYENSALRLNGAKNPRPAIRSNFINHKNPDSALNQKSLSIFTLQPPQHFAPTQPVT